ncbi:MAG: orotidine 5'-phosphate decarboxylase [Calditrichaceae bacterium]|nr:orotidine 5'-phosphate decarboxylase [Calditrichaceae bacterium]
MNKIRKIIPALDVKKLEEVVNLIKAVDQHPILYGYKIGFSLGLTYGLPKIVEAIRAISDKPVIYDHQKAATDIPDTGKLFALVMKESGVDEVILFPQAGPATLQAWVEALKEKELTVIVGGIMTHPKFVISEGGYIRDDGVWEMYRLSHSLGVDRFVVPLTKPEATRKLYAEAALDDGCVFYSPGYGKQGGDPQEFDFLRTHFLIIGRSLLQAANPLDYLSGVEKDLQRLK